MGVVGVRELAHSASKLIRGVRRTGRPLVVTVRGRPVAAVIPFDEGDLEDYVLAHAAEFVQGRAEADRNLAAGRTEPLSKVLAELDDSPARMRNHVELDPAVKRDLKRMGPGPDRMRVVTAPVEALEPVPRPGNADVKVLAGAARGCGCGWGTGA